MFQILNTKYQILIQELFYALTVSLVIFSVLELIKPRLILAYFNLNWLLLGWLIIGIILLLSKRENNDIKL